MTLDASVITAARVCGVISFNISFTSRLPSFKGAYFTLIPLPFKLICDGAQACGHVSINMKESVGTVFGKTRSVVGIPAEILAQKFAAGIDAL